MAADEAEVQELIVRALTGKDQSARAALESAALKDEELRRFCAEMEALVRSLQESTAWRREAPGAALSARVREAVVNRLPAAPPQVQATLVEAGLAGRRAVRRRLLILLVLLCAPLVVLSVWLALRRGDPGRFALQGRSAFAAAPGGDRSEDWEHAPEGVSGGLAGLAAPAPAARVIRLKRSFPAEAALAAEVEFEPPEGAAELSVSLFLAEAQGASPPLWGMEARPERALLIECSADGVVLLDPARRLLCSFPHPPGGFCRLRLEHLGNAARVLLNGRLLYDGPQPQPLRGRLHPGLRLAGAGKEKVLVKAFRVEE